MKILLVCLILFISFSCEKSKNYELTDKNVQSENISKKEIDHRNYSLKIFREESNGRMNIIPCEIFIQKDENLINTDSIIVIDKYSNSVQKRVYLDHFYMIGGDIALVDIPKGNYIIKIITPKELHNEYLGNENDWNSEEYFIEINEETKKILYVFPGQNNGYNGSWILSDKMVFEYYREYYE
jgi:hypothetical protein